MKILALIRKDSPNKYDDYGNEQEVGTPTDPLALHVVGTNIPTETPKNGKKKK